MKPLWALGNLFPFRSIFFSSLQFQSFAYACVCERYMMRCMGRESMGKGDKEDLGEALAIRGGFFFFEMF